MEQSGLLTDIAIALGLALLGGYLAQAVRVPPIVGYLFAGVAISPFTPGYSANLETLREVAELGVIFLMFGIGLHFDVRQLLRLRAATIPGAVLLMVFTVGAGIAGATGLGFDWKAGLVLGLGMGVASSTVISRALIDHGLGDSTAGNLAIGWSIVEDLLTVLMLALLPSLGPDSNTNPALDATVSLSKAALFLAIMLALGVRVIPWAMRRVAALGSRELFILSVVALALGIAVSGAEFFGVSVAIGAFVAGVAISETEMGHQATADVLPLRDAFAVLFFVSVGMLVEPDVIAKNLDLLAVIVLIAVVGKFLFTMVLFAFFPFSGRTALVTAAMVAQYGEFAFIIAGVALEARVIGNEIYNLVLAGAAIVIGLNPIILRLALRGHRWLERTGPIWRLIDRQGPEVPAVSLPRGEHVIVLGYGRVGELVGHALLSLSRPFVVVEGEIGRARRLSDAGLAVVWGDAANEQVLTEAGVARASLLVAALPDENSTLLAVSNARRLAPTLRIIARARSSRSALELKSLGAEEVVVPTFEGGLELMQQTLVRLGYPEEESARLRDAVRDIQYEALAREPAGPDFG